MTGTIRLAGFLYLINIAGGVFAEGFVRSAMVVRGNAADTAANIMAHESLFRWGFAAGIVVVVTNLPLALVFYHLFKRVDRLQAGLIACFLLVGTAVEAMNLLNHYAPLSLLGTGGYQAILPGEQAANLSYLALRLHAVGYNISLVFFGFYGILTGRLILKSPFMPGVLGVLLIAGGTGYLVNSFSSFLTPWIAASLFPYVLLPAFLAETGLATWLLLTKKAWPA
jgi:hypothetical protein